MHFERAAPSFARARQAVNRQVETRQYRVVDDVVQEYRIGIEGVLVENDAVRVRLFLADGFAPCCARAIREDNDFREIAVLLP